MQGEDSRRCIVRTICVSLACALILVPLSASAADTNPNASIAVKTSMSGPLKAAIARAGDDATLLRMAAGARQNPTVETPKRSWMSRHPALFGALVGCGAGTLIGAVAGHPEPEEGWSSRGGMIAFGAMTGAGLGALSGWIVGLAR